ncbi:MAG: hypothetical protein WD042_15480 [Phycisphaeraceae bacterium]
MMPMLAQYNERWEMLEAISEAFVNERFGVPTAGLVICAVVLAVLLGLGVRRWWGQQQGQAAPLRTFSHIAGDLGLTWVEQWLLWRIARQQQLPTPLTLLISPATLDHHAGRYVQSLASPRQVQRAEAKTQAIRRRLFGE